jgi:hypothetical protein
MTEFEFIATFLSVVFGLAVSNLLSGMARSYYQNLLNATRLGWSLTIGVTLLVNWWGLFRWSDHGQWYYEDYLVLTAWATAHYLLAVALYPAQQVVEISIDRQRKAIGATWLSACTLDAIETSLRGDLLEPWFLPVFYLLLASLVVIMLYRREPAVDRFVGWTMFTLMLLWSLFVRRLLIS